jgi:glycosyltransferase involved in cell wall biosynthesis
VSILIPVFERAELVGAAIASALAQTEADLEVVVSDNASQDGTWDVIQANARRDARVKALRQERNVGPVANWLACAQTATGDLAGLLFSDDTWEPTFVARAAKFLADPAVGFAYSQVLRVSASSSARCYTGVATGMVPSMVHLARLYEGAGRVRVPVSPGCALFRRSDVLDALEAPWPDPLGLGFWRHGAGPDVWLYLRALACHPLCAHVASPLVHFLAHPANLSERPEVPVSYAATLHRFLIEAPLDSSTRSALAAHNYVRLWRLRRDPRARAMLRDAGALASASGILRSIMGRTVRRALDYIRRPAEAS